MYFGGLQTFTERQRRQDGDTVAAGIFADGYFAGWRRKTGTGGVGMTRVLVVDDQRIAREYMAVSYTHLRAHET